MNQEQFLLGQNQALQAIYVPSVAKKVGTHFLTNPENDLQIGLMTRDSNSPVLAHQHQKFERMVTSTQEFIWIRDGKAEILIYNENQSISHRLILSTGDSILFISGGHAINFLTSTQLLEIKQGPYQQSLDKAYLSSNQ